MALSRGDAGWAARYHDGSAYQVTGDGGLTVRASPFDGSAEQLIRLAGPITALVMAVTGHYPVHGCGIRVGDRLVGLHAASGGGKSTLAAVAARAGHAIAGDDLLALGPDGMVAGAVGTLRIHPDRAPEHWTAALVLPDGRGWYPLPPLPALPLSALVQVHRGDRVVLQPVRGSRRLTAIMAAGFLSHLDPDPPAAWHSAVATLAASVPVYRLQVPEGLAALDAAWPEIAGRLGAL